MEVNAVYCETHKNTVRAKTTSLSQISWCTVTCPRHEGTRWGEGRGIAPLIRILDSRWRWVVNLTHRERNRCPLNRRLGGQQSWSGRFAKEKDLLNLLELKPW